MFEKSRKVRTLVWPLKCRFQFYWSEKLETWSESRYGWNDIAHLVRSRDLLQIFWAALYFTHQLFCHFTDCSVKYLEISIWNFQGLFLTSIWIIFQNFMKLACLEDAFSKIGIFRILVCNLQTGSAMSKFFWFRTSLWLPTSVKIFMVLPFVVFENSVGEATSPQMPLSCQKRQMPLLKGERGVQGQRLDLFYFFTVKSSTLDGIITFYRMKISLHAL